MIENKEKKYILHNLEDIISEIPIEKYDGYCQLNRFLKVLKKLRYTLSLDEINYVKKIVIKRILEKAVGTKLDSDYIENIDFITIETQIDEILKNEHKNIFDIMLIINSCYSDVYNVENKVIKLGAPRKTHKMPYHRRFLASVVRNKFLLLAYNRNVFVEIEEITDPLKGKANLTEKQKLDIVYMIYREMRNDGLIWIDPKVSNVGILRRSNKTYVDGIDDVNKESLGYIKDTITNDRPLRKGCYVIIDKDATYKEEDFDYKIHSKGFNMSHFDSMEKRYQKELKRKKQSEL